MCSGVPSLSSHPRFPGRSCNPALRSETPWDVLTLCSSLLPPPGRDEQWLPVIISLFLRTNLAISGFSMVLCPVLFKRAPYSPAHPRSLPTTIQHLQPGVTPLSCRFSKAPQPSSLGSKDSSPLHLLGSDATSSSTAEVPLGAAISKVSLPLGERLKYASSRPTSQR